ncbi:MAG: carbamoyltransferase [Candidatus Azotimanducaceae bacterium]|jgi:carbamoyltransferase
MNIIGISAYYHDSAAALIQDGKISAAAQEERFTRKKHDPAFPVQAIQYCLQQSGLVLSEVDYVIFYDKPLIKFERLLETYLAYAPKGFRSFLASMPVWLQEKLFLKQELRRELSELSGLSKQELPKLLFNEHHQSHAASAFFPSPYKKAAVLCLDGVGEWATSSVWLGEDNKLTPLWEIDFPHSLGLLYSAFTYYTGFKVNSGEYKLMGLAPYGEPKYVPKIMDNLIDVKEDGTFRLDMQYFDYAAGLTMTNQRFDDLFDGPRREPESEVSQKEMDLARSIQVVTEEIILKLTATIYGELNVEHLCLAGGVALNCVANGRILRESPFKDIWIQPAAGDAGGALGAALSVWYEYLDNPREARTHDDMSGSYLGGSFSNSQIISSLDALEASYKQLDDGDLFHQLADILCGDNVVGWFSGRMEFGPRALGGRSILGDPRSKKMQSIMNLRIKYRESFRPFAPAIKAESVFEWFEIDRPSPYMLLVADVKEEKRIQMSEAEQALFGIEKLNIARSKIPAVTHVDYSARIQTVHAETNPRFHRLISEFEKQSQCPILINTSFNVRGEPIVYSPEDAYRCFMRTDMDYLVLENVFLKKSDQPILDEDESWKQTFELD